MQCLDAHHPPCLPTPVLAPSKLDPSPLLSTDSPGSLVSSNGGGAYSMGSGSVIASGGGMGVDNGAAYGGSSVGEVQEWASRQQTQPQQQQQQQLVGPGGWKDNKKGGGIDGSGLTSSGPVLQSSGSECASQEGDAESPDSERLMKEFVAALGGFFGPPQSMAGVAVGGGNGGSSGGGSVNNVNSSNGGGAAAAATVAGGSAGGVGSGRPGGAPQHELRLNANALGSRRGPPSSSSQFRGVTRHRRTKKWESHIWYNKKQLYLGGFKEAVDAAKAHDIMGLKLRGSKAHTNFEPNGYARLLPFLDKLLMEQVIEALRMVSKGADFGTCKKPSRSVRSAMKMSSCGGYALSANSVEQQSSMDRAMISASTGEDDGSLIPCLSENFQTSLLPPLWNKEQDLNGGVMLNSASAYSTIPDMLSAPLNGPACGIMDDTGDAAWTPIMYQNDPLLADGPSSPFVQYATQGDLGPMEMLSSSKELAGVGLSSTQRTASDPLSNFDDPTSYNLQELLGQGPAGRRTSDPANQDALVVKVPVMPSKVIRYPSAPVQQMQTQPDHPGLWTSGLTDPYSQPLSRACSDHGVGPADFAQYPMGNPSMGLELESQLRVNHVQGHAGPGLEAYTSILDSQASALTGLSSTGSGGAMTINQQMCGPRGSHCI